MRSRSASAQRGYRSISTRRAFALRPATQCVRRTRWIGGDSAAATDCTGGECGESEAADSREGAAGSAQADIARRKGVGVHTDGDRPRGGC